MGGQPRAWGGVGWPKVSRNQVRAGKEKASSGSDMGKISKSANQQIGKSTNRQISAIVIG
jgi:hypothetical protein